MDTHGAKHTRSTVLTPPTAHGEASFWEADCIMEQKNLLDNANATGAFVNDFTVNAFVNY